MTLAFAIAVNVIAIVALAGTLVYAMSRAARLTPHAPATVVPTFRPIHFARSARARQESRPSGILSGARS
jgi:hypothetical protein